MITEEIELMTYASGVIGELVDQCHQAPILGEILRITGVGDAYIRVHADVTATVDADGTPVIPPALAREIYVWLSTEGEHYADQILAAGGDYPATYRDAAEVDACRDEAQRSLVGHVSDWLERHGDDGTVADAFGDAVYYPYGM